MTGVQTCALPIFCNKVVLPEPDRPIMAICSPFFSSLSLTRHGLDWIQPELALAHPLDDGSAAILSHSLEDTCTSLGEDGRAYRQLIEPLLRKWEMLVDEFLQPIVHLPRHPWRVTMIAWRQTSPANPVVLWNLRRSRRSRLVHRGWGALLPNRLGLDTVNELRRDLGNLLVVIFLHRLWKTRLGATR